MTTPDRIRVAILWSDRPAAELGRRYGVSERTVFRYWKNAGRAGQKTRSEIKAILGSKPAEPFT